MDTSVFGGCFDEEFSRESRTLFEEIAAGKFSLVVSEATLFELQGAPNQVRAILDGMNEEDLEIVETTPEIEALRDAYLSAGVLGPASRQDAAHVAAASVADVDIIVSWNFRHIVHYEKIRAFHAVNLIHGYRSIPIHSPREVVAP
ncbi:MAG: PIN domain-containing protein [Planctomycetes bacterium]|nr:PIN domain-containing protein [Planctomycetota bacterium]